jgi:hypothetical protein
MPRNCGGACKKPANAGFRFQCSGFRKTQLRVVHPDTRTLRFPGAYRDRGDPYPPEQEGPIRHHGHVADGRRSCGGAGSVAGGVTGSVVTGSLITLSLPAAPIHAAPPFFAFFVPRVVVYASSQDFVETALGHPYLNTKGAFMPALYPIPGFSTHPDHIRAHTISPHKPASAIYLLFCCQVPPFRAASRCLFARSAPPFSAFLSLFPFSAFSFQF